WQNTPFSPQTGIFTVEYDVTPNGTNIDAITALSLGPGSTFSNFSVLVRFNSAGNIDVRNNDTYQADIVLPYTAGVSYHFRLEIDVPQHIYSVYVTPSGGSEQVLASNYDFRLEQNTVTSLDNWGLWAGVGSHEVCNLVVSEITGNNFFDHYIENITTNPKIDQASVQDVEWDGVTRYYPTGVGSGEIPNNSPDLETLLHLDENPGAQVFLDSSGNGNGGVCSGSTCPESGVVGQISNAVTFDGADDYIEVAPLDFNGPYTLSLWFKINEFDADWEAVISQDDRFNGPFNWAGFWIDPSGFLNSASFGACGSSGTLSSVNLAENTWYHVAVVSNGVNERAVYIDGQNIQNFSTSPCVLGAPLVLGSRHGFYDDNFNGSIDDVGFWNRQLTSGEIGTIYQDGVAGSGSSGSFVSAEIDTNSIYYVFNASWFESVSGVNMEISTDNGNNWCSIENSGELDSECLDPQVGAINFTYRINFDSFTEIDWVNFTWDSTPPPPGEVCGDGVIEGDEVCECGLDGICGNSDDDLNGESCVTQNYDSGDLFCGVDCLSFDTSSCTSPPPPGANQECFDGEDNDGDNLTDFDDFGCFGPNGQETNIPDGNYIDYGWTQFYASPDTVIVYVSNSTGDNTYSGFAPEWNGTDGPKATIGAGSSLLRDGFPDWLLLKRGDEWQYQGLGFGKSGRSETELVLISAYGQGPRPILLGKSGKIISIFGADKNYQAIAHIHFIYDIANGNDPQQDSAIIRLSGGSHFLIEGNLFEDFGKYAIVVQAFYGPISDVSIRRNVIYNTYSGAVYLSGIDGVEFDENVLDYIGLRWSETHTSVVAPQALYVQFDNSNVSVRGNIFSRVASSGVQLRPGGEASGNLFVRNPMAVFIGHPQTDPGADVIAVNNVVLDGVDMVQMGGDIIHERGWGIRVDTAARFDTADVSKNIIALKNETTAGWALSIWASFNNGGLFENNIIYKWPGHMVIRGGFNPENVTVKNSTIWADEGHAIRHEGSEQLSQAQLRNNRYFSSNVPDGNWFRIGSYDSPLISYADWASQ
ncbi:MAG: LamG domain-containing protein, partial [Bacteroidetes bacterium]|nr:LamG domain-containing protein [Bacteroidota bacterium]